MNATHAANSRTALADRKPRPARANQQPSPPFKVLTVAQIRRLCAELAPAELKVWLYHYGRSGVDDSSYPQLDTIAWETNQNVGTVKLARKRLRDNRWLATIGHVAAGRGRVPVLRAVFPEKPLPLRVEKPPSVDSLRVEKPPCKNPPAEVDSKSEVQPSPTPPASRAGNQIFEIPCSGGPVRIAVRRDQTRIWRQLAKKSWAGTGAWEIAAYFQSQGFAAEYKVRW